MKANTVVKRIVDAAMIVLLLLLMAFQVTQQLAHEWLGIAMFVLTIAHQILNRKFYASIFKGKYSPIRVFQLIVNLLLILSFLGTALCGMMISRYAAPFMNGLLPSSVVRQGHLALSHWSFVLMGIHFGLHFGIIASKIKNKAVSITLSAILCCISVYGFCLFFRSDILKYMLLQNPFAFLDYDKAWWLVILENLAMLLAWAFAAYLFSLFLRSVVRKDKRRISLLYILLAAAIVIIPIFINAADHSQQNQPSASWKPVQKPAAASQLPAADTHTSTDHTDSNVTDNYVLIKGGTFMMGNPENENWRSNDELRHQVSVADFYISPYEITQAEYQSVTGNNPSSFQGDTLPAENISYIEALQFANLKSKAEGLTPVYTISGRT